MKYFSYFFAALLAAVWFTGVLWYKATGIFHLILVVAILTVLLRMIEGNMSLKKYRKHKEN